MSLIHIAGVLAALVGVAIIAIGARFLLAPQRSAKDFGLPDWPHGDASGWLDIKGVRDIVSGLVLLPALLLGEFRLLGWMLLAAALTPIGDAITVLRHHGSKALAYGMHGGTALAVVAIACLLLLGH